MQTDIKPITLFNQIITKLGLDENDYIQWKNKSQSFLLHQLRRKIRYNCFAMQREQPDNIPEKFIKYFESQEHFSGWDLFADRWDVSKDNPSETYPRLLSTLDEWEAKLKMCVPEIPGAIAYKQST